MASLPAVPKRLAPAIAFVGVYGSSIGVLIEVAVPEAVDYNPEAARAFE
jgi:hypothetical protein